MPGGGFDRRQSDGGAHSAAQNASSPGPGKGTLVDQIPVQRFSNSAPGSGEPAASDVHAAAAQGVAGAGGPLPHGATIQQLFGHHDITGVQAHVGGPAAEASRAIGAEAYATGHHVAFAGAPDLHTAAHEAAHVVQQRGGVQLKGGVGQTGDAYEQHADQVADAVVQGRSAEALLDRHAGAGGSGAEITQRATSQSVQLMKVGDDAVAATVSSTTRNKHVVPVSDQAAKAQAEYLSTTFVASEADITRVVDANSHQFQRSSQRSDQVTIHGNVKVYLWKKDVPGRGNPATLEVDGLEKECEIGVVKTGDNKVQVVHFKATLI